MATIAHCWAAYDNDASRALKHGRWIEHFTELFNQPGIVGDRIDMCLPAQRVVNIKIKTGL